MERRVELPANTAAVWRALTQGSELSGWFGAVVELDARSGGRVTFLWPDGRAREARIEVFDPQRQLLLRWLPFERDAEGAIQSQPPGYIRFVLEPRGDGTLLSVTEALFGEPRETTMASVGKGSAS